MNALATWILLEGPEIALCAGPERGRGREGRTGDGPPDGGTSEGPDEAAAEGAERLERTAA